jgi:hypothetical protein
MPALGMPGAPIVAIAAGKRSLSNALVLSSRTLDLLDQSFKHGVNL